MDNDSLWNIVHSLPPPATGVKSHANKSSRLYCKQKNDDQTRDIDIQSGGGSSGFNITSTSIAVKDGINKMQSKQSARSHDSPKLSSKIPRGDGKHGNSGIPVSKKATSSSGSGKSHTVQYSHADSYPVRRVPTPFVDDVLSARGSVPVDSSSVKSAKSSSSAGERSSRKNTLMTTAQVHMPSSFNQQRKGVVLSEQNIPSNGKSGKHYQVTSGSVVHMESRIPGNPAIQNLINNEKFLEGGNGHKRSMSPASYSDSLPSKRHGGSGHNDKSSVPPTGVVTSDLMLGGGVCCEHCNNCLIEFKRQALRLTFPEREGQNPSLLKDPEFFNKLEDKLEIPGSNRKFFNRSRCDVCDTHVLQLKREAIMMVQAIQHAQQDQGSGTNIPALVGSRSVVPYNSAGNQGDYDQRGGITGIPTNSHSRSLRSTRSSSSSSSSSPSASATSAVPIAAQAQAYLEQNVRAWMHNPKKGGQPMLLSQDPATGAQMIAYGGNMDPTQGHMVIQGQGHSGIPHGHYNGHYDVAYPITPLMTSSGQQQHHRHHSSTLQGGHGHQQYQPSYYYHHPQQQISSHQIQHYQHQHGVDIPMVASPPPSVTGQSTSGGTSSSHSAAASFFARAAQKLSISSKKRSKRHYPSEPVPPVFATNFSGVIHVSPPPAPPCLLRTAGRVVNPGTGKVKVMLRICPNMSSHSGDQGTSILSVDPRKKQVTVFDPSHCGYTTSAHRRAGVSAPKMFAFDAVFAQDDSLTEICSSSLTEIVQAVVNGADGCLFTYGQVGTGKTDTLVGSDYSTQTLGIVPCAIAWLFKLINEQKEKTGARFSVRVSAVEVTGKQETLKDLLTEVATGQESGIGTAPGVYLRDDPIIGTQLENQSELRAPNAEKATFYLDAALAARTPHDDEDARSSHMLFTVHVYQYRIEKSVKVGLPAVDGGRSRLHLIDLGSSSKSKDPTGVALSLSAIGNVILALLNGQRHVPHRDSKIAQLLRDSLGNLTCRICMIAHVSSSVSHHSETLQIIQLAARIHRMKRRKNKMSSTSSEDSSCDGDFRMRRYPRTFRGGNMGTLREDIAMTHSDPDCTSSSEQSCDTVIYLGSAGGRSLSDRELTDNESPPRSVPRTNPRLPSKSPRRSGSRSSGDERSDSDSRSSISQEGRYFPGEYFMGKMPLPGGPGSPSTHPIHNVTSSPITSPPMSPGSRRVHIRTSTLARPKYHSDSEDSSSHHSYGTKPDMAPSMPRTNGNLWYREKMEGGPIEGEKWVDGPGTVIYPANPNSNEQWVDGPSAFVVKKDSLKRQRNPAVNPEEKWVDGPTEMIVSKPESSKSKSAKPVHSHVKADIKSSSSGKGNQLDSGHVSSLHRSLRQSRTPAVPVLETEIRPNSMHSTESQSSTKGQVGGLRHELPLQSEDGKKAFVKEWVDKHSPLTSDIHPEKEFARAISESKASSSSSHKQQTHKCANEKVCTKAHAVELRKIASSGNSPKHSPYSSPKSSPATHRKVNKTSNNSTNNGGNPSQANAATLPQSVSPSLRVAQWVKSVTSSSSPHSQSDPLDIQAPSAKSVNGSNRDLDLSSMSAVSSSTVQYLHSNSSGVNTNNNSASISRLDSSSASLSNCDITDTSFSHLNECDTSKSNGVCVDNSYGASAESNDDPHNDSFSTIDTSGCDISNRESIYELEFDEQIANHLAGDIPDDETFSTLSQHTKDTDIMIDDVLDACIRESRLPKLVIESGNILTTKNVLTNSRKIENNSTCVSFSNRLDISDVLREETIFEEELSPILELSANKLRLRCPDGASNPNLSLEYFAEQESTSAESSILDTTKGTETISSSSSYENVEKQHGAVTVANVRHVSLLSSFKPNSSTSSSSSLPRLIKSQGHDIRCIDGQSESESKPVIGSPKFAGVSTPVKCESRGKPPLPAKPGSASKASILQKASPVHSTSGSSIRESTPVKLSKSAKDSKLNSNSNGRENGKSSGLPVANRGRDKDKDKSHKSPLFSSSSRSSSQPSTATCSPMSNASTRSSKSSKSQSPGRSRLPLFSCKSNSQSSKESTKVTTKKSSSSKKEKISTVSSGSQKASHNRVTELGHGHREADSDSGNDSGIVTPERKKLHLSPYTTITKPRTQSHSSSGHGSDNSSIISADMLAKTPLLREKMIGGTSSGYESMLRDSEATGTSSSAHDDTASESGGEKGNGAKDSKKKSSGTRRSRSAPARSSDSPSHMTTANSGRQSPDGQNHGVVKPSPKAWVDTRHIQGFMNEPFELESYETEDINRLNISGKYRGDDEMLTLEERREQIRELLTKQDDLKDELSTAKDRLMVERSTWSFDCKLLLCFSCRSQKASTDTAV